MLAGLLSLVVVSLLHHRLSATIPILPEDLESKDCGSYDLEKEYFSERYDSWEGKASFFIPASGSGSRMFAELAQFVTTGEESDALTSFFDELPALALFQELPLVVREKFEALQSIYLAEC